MLRCASSFVIAAYAKVRLIPQDSCALPADFFYEAVPFSGLLRLFTRSSFLVYDKRFNHSWMTSVTSSHPGSPTTQWAWPLSSLKVDRSPYFSWTFLTTAAGVIRSPP